MRQVYINGDFKKEDDDQNENDEIKSSTSFTDISFDDI